MLYRVVLQGTIAAGAEAPAVRRRFCELTGATAATVERLFVGIPRTVKRQVPEHEAARIATALTAIGAPAFVEPDVPTIALDLDGVPLVSAATDPASATATASQIPSHSAPPTPDVPKLTQGASAKTQRVAVDSALKERFATLVDSELLQHRARENLTATAYATLDELIAERGLDVPSEIAARHEQAAAVNRAARLNRNLVMSIIGYVVSHSLSVLLLAEERLRPLGWLMAIVVMIALAFGLALLMQIAKLLGRNSVAWIIGVLAPFAVSIYLVRELEFRSIAMALAVAWAIFALDIRERRRSSTVTRADDDRT